MIRARLLRENGKYLPRQSFAMRRHWFNNEETGYFKVQKRAAASQVMIQSIYWLTTIDGHSIFVCDASAQTGSQPKGWGWWRGD